MRKFYYLLGAASIVMLYASSSSARTTWITGGGGPIFSSGTNLSTDKGTTCDKAIYSLRGKMGNADCTSCSDSQGTFYKCDCKSGFTLNYITGKCEEVDCDDYPILKSNVNSNSGVYDCIQCGNDTKCKCTNSKDGYTLKNGVCEAKTCDRAAFPLAQAPGINCTDPRYCQAGSNTYFGCKDCADGYELNTAQQCIAKVNPVPEEPTPEEPAPVFEDPTPKDDTPAGLDPTPTPNDPKPTDQETPQEPESEPVAEPEPKNQLECNVGDVYYDDNTCSPDVMSGKKAIGIVIDNIRKIVIALESKELPWNDGSQRFYEINDLNTKVKLVQGGYQAEDVNLLNGRRNTEIIMQFAKEKNQTHKAAQYCYNYNLGGQQWFLPSTAETGNQANIYLIAEKMKKIPGATPLASTFGTNSVSTVEHMWISLSSGEENAFVGHLGTTLCSVQKHSAAKGSSCDGFHNIMTRCVFSYGDTDCKQRGFDGFNVQTKACVTCPSNKPFDKVEGACTTKSNANCSGFTLESCPALYKCESCKSGLFTKYKITGCDYSYKLQNGKCVEDCPKTEYPECIAAVQKGIEIKGTPVRNRYASDLNNEGGSCNACKRPQKWISAGEIKEAKCLAAQSKGYSVIDINYREWIEYEQTKGLYENMEDYIQDQHPTTKYTQGISLTERNAKYMGIYDDIKRYSLGPDHYKKNEVRETVALLFTETDCENIVSKYFPVGAVYRFMEETDAVGHFF